MRLRRLELSRYGLFTDHALDFGRPDGGPDLHIVYGPNEAGKSTALAAFLDLLFAFEARSRYSFLHGYNAMRVEADLEIGGETRRFARIRKRRGSLLDGHGSPVPDGAIANALGGMDRDTYRAMFSLDDDTLEAGGEEILRSEGHLGRLLFASGAGLVELSETLNRLRDKADEFRKDYGRKTKLNGLKRRLGEIDGEKKKLDTAASEFVRLTEDRDRAKDAYEKATAERAALETEREDARRRLQGLPWLAEIRRLREELADLAGLPEVPGNWSEQVERFMERHPALTAERAGFVREKRRLTEKREALGRDSAILGLESRVRALDNARARHVTAAEDLPQRRATLREQDGAVRTLVRRLDGPTGAAPAALVIPAGVAGSLTDLIERRSGIETRLRTAAAELTTAEDMDGAAQREVDKRRLPGRDDDALDRLNEALEAARGGDHATRTRVHTQRRDELRIKLDSLAAQLHPWTGPADALTRIHAPERSELEAWRSAFDRANAEVERLEQDETRLLGARVRHRERMTAKVREAGIVDDAEAARLRRLRDEAWETHRARLDGPSADAFAERLKDDDAATAARLARATDLAALRQASKEARDNDREIERNTRELARARRRREEVLDEITAAVRRMIATGADDMPSDAALPKLADWVDRRAAIIETLTDMRREEHEMDRARADAETLRERLSSALAAGGIDHDPTLGFDELVRRARVAVETAREHRDLLRSARREAERARAVLNSRRRELETAKKDDTSWRADWTAALSRCWLGAVTPEPGCAAARPILDDAAELESVLEQRAMMADRIGKMEQDQSDFVAGVRAIAERLGDAFDASEPVVACDGLIARLDRAIRNRDESARLRQEIEGVVDSIAGVESELAEIDTVAGEMFAAFGVDSLGAVRARLEQAARRAAAREELAEREARLVEATQAESPEAAEAALADADRAALARRIAEIEARLGDAAGATNILHSTLQRAEDALHAVSGDGAVARLEAERRTVLLEIEEGARDYLRLRLGITAAEHALAAYRDAHRSSMMKRASEAFRIISLGAYSRLDSELTGKGEVLMGIGAGGGSKIASDMSKGARFQLYLALRVAGYREFVEQHGPVPFIADDILETFDDFRAEEAFRLFADMAERGQVVYLSHHRHLCRIAEDVCPGVTIHELPAADGARASA